MRYFRAINPQQQNFGASGGGNAAKQPSYSLAGMQQPQQMPITQQFMQSGALQSMPFVQQAQYPNQQMSSGFLPGEPAPTPMYGQNSKQDSTNNIFRGAYSMPFMKPITGAPSLTGQVQYPMPDGITPLPGDIRYPGPWSPPNPPIPQVQNNWNRVLQELGPNAAQILSDFYGGPEGVKAQDFNWLKEMFRLATQPGGFYGAP